MLLARDGHQVTVLERDPAAPPPHADAAWEGWQRRGVNQFRLPHFMLPRWWSQLRAELPEVRDPLDAFGALHLNVIAALPAARRGPMRDGDERFDTVTARRPVLEAALSAAAEAAGVTIRRGVTVTGLTTDGPARVPRVTGVLTENGSAVAADRPSARGWRRPVPGARRKSGPTAALSTTPGISAPVAENNRPCSATSCRATTRSRPSRCPPTTAPGA
jgi:2-polyprenyl-6-methoxyphenol hydroxylase-like FAD-dependent oxidoreductase